ncbi:MAG: GTPase Era [Deltaproteobacteria bacterium]|jgi:GTP-binding protein Era|nr:GTPase Era [Deltaproteobacteria bacterium]
MNDHQDSDNRDTSANLAAPGGADVGDRVDKQSEDAASADDPAGNDAASADSVSSEKSGDVGVIKDSEDSEETKDSEDRIETKDIQDMSAEKEQSVEKDLSAEKDRPAHRAGFVAIMGAPNAGKSSLMNKYLGQKVAIVTRKPQTTRHRILGVLTEPRGQLVFWDTPGVHNSRKALNREMMSRAQAALADSDVCLWLIDGQRQGPEHKLTGQLVTADRRKPLIVCLNKIDLLGPDDVAAWAGHIDDEIKPEAFLAVSARTGFGLDKLKDTLIAHLPPNPPLFSEDTLTDQTLRAIAAEYVREAVFDLTRQELPYSTAVTIDEFKEPDPRDRKPLYRISATIHVERESQKKLMIGRRGVMLKNVGQKARLGLEEILEGQLFLSLFVRVTSGWSEDSRSLEEFAYGEFD